MKHVLAAIAAVVGIAAPATATKFYFSYTFDLGAHATGFLDGDQTGNIINNISNVSVFVEGHAFEGNGHLSIFSWHDGWVEGGAYVSIDGTENSFHFTDAPDLYSWTNQFFGITGAAAHPPASPDEIAYDSRNFTFGPYSGVGDFPPNDSWRAWAAPVPEVQTWATMVIGFGFIGASMKPRRRIAVTFE